MGKNKGLKRLGFLIIILVVMILYSNNMEVEHLSIDLQHYYQAGENIRIVQVSDVHIPKNLIALDKLTAEIKALEPDVIVLTGDIVDSSYKGDLSMFESFCMDVSKINKTFMVTGNHEVWNRNLDEIIQIVKKNNIVLLENETEIHMVKNNRIAFIGVSDGLKMNQTLLDNPSIEDMPKVLLCHRPEVFEDMVNSKSKIKADLSFAGHYHGGQFRVPLVNVGILAPTRSFFPKFVSGKYTSGESVLVMSRGLGNSIIPVRIFNRPHLLVIDMAV